MESKKMKVLCVTRKYPPSVGGMENLCYNVFNGIKDENISVNIVAMGKSQINLIWFFPYAIFYVLFCAHKYDVLLLGDSLLCFLGNVCKLVSRKTKRVIIVHGLDFTFNNLVYQLYLRMFYKKSGDEYICNSKETQKNLNKWGIGYSKVITPGINADKFNLVNHDKKAFKEKYGIAKDNIVIITVGRLVRRKGVLWFVTEVMPKVKKLPITYLIIGDGPDKEIIKSAIEKNDLSENVKMLGRISDNDLDQCYCNADIFMMPNVPIENDIEGFGIVALEASLAGLLVVASGIDGITDAIIDGKNGILMSSENTEAYVELLNDIAKNYDIYADKKKTFPDYTLKNYSWENICHQYKELFKKICV